eukprot:402611-Pelagomonas_calceolata.AAC.1
MRLQDCFRTPERARHLPCQQQFFGGGRGGALRVLLSKKSSLNMATPGSPSSPHLDATPSRVCVQSSETAAQIVGDVVCAWDQKQPLNMATLGKPHPHLTWMPHKTGY